ncbi:MAG: HepT-like ribonuclease domain-containing protein [Phycisphaerales bacterium]
MRPDPENNPALIADMLAYSRAVVRLCAGRSEEELAENEMFRLAVERAIQIVCEAARLLTRECRDAHPDIPWKAIIGQRHVLVHDYGELDHTKLWRVASVHIPALIPQLEAILPPPPPDPPEST